MTTGSDEARRTTYPVIAAVMLDAMAAIAGPPGARGYERTWSAALELVLAMTVEGAGEWRARRGGLRK